jgi:hypothetical protein
MNPKIKTFNNCFSPERTAVFFAISCKSNLREESLLDLYMLDIKLCQSLYVLLHCLELSLRNKIHCAAVEFYGKENWIDCINWSEFQKNQIDSAKIKSEKEAKMKGKRNYNISDLICNLTFGFWVDLFSNEYAELWKNVLSKIFVVDELKRKRIHSLLLGTRRIRNRIAHYEIIIKNKNVLHNRYEELTELLSLLSPDLFIYKYEKNVMDKLLGDLNKYDC